MIEHRRLRVYVAGPISGNVFENVFAAIRMGKRMVMDGLAPYVPHFDAFMFPAPDEVSWNAFLEWDLEWVAQTEAMFMMPWWETSKGAALERSRAEALGIPVFAVYEDLLDHAESLNLTGVRR